MAWLVFTFLLTTVASLILTGVVRELARRWGVVDRPDGQRKLHRGAIPLWGGVAVYLSLALGLLAARFSGLGAGAPLADLSLVTVLVAGFVCALGAIDDVYPMSSRRKLLLQVFATMPAIFLGYWVDRIGLFGYGVNLGWLGIPLTIFWLLGCINALNLLDGMDGLASVVGLSTAAMLGIIAASSGYYHVSLVALVLAGALLGFLVYNLPPASIFLGDSGSMVIGVIVGMLGIQGAIKTPATLAITAPAVVMTLPMLDVVLAIMRRKLRGRPIGVADREHIHHRLLDRGMTPWQVLCILGAVCLTTGGAAAAGAIMRSDAVAWVVAITVIVAAVRFRLFGDHEFSLAKQSVSGWLADFLRRRAAGFSRRALPPSDHWIELPFRRAWNRLIAAVKPWRVDRLEVCLLDEGQPSRQCVWSDPQSGQRPDREWSIAVDVSTSGTEVCRVIATFFDRQSGDPPHLAEVGLLLREFALRAAADTASIPAVQTPALELEEVASDRGRQRRAA